MMSARKTISYYMVFSPYPKKGATVRVVYTDGSTETRHFGDRGFEAAYKRGMRGKR